MSREACPVCGSYPHMSGARFCWVCGSPMEGCAGCVNEKADRDQDCCWNCARNGRTRKRDLYQHVTGTAVKAEEVQDESEVSE